MWYLEFHLKLDSREKVKTLIHGRKCLNIQVFLMQQGRSLITKYTKAYEKLEEKKRIHSHLKISPPERQVNTIMLTTGDFKLVISNLHGISLLKMVTTGSLGRT